MRTHFCSLYYHHDRDADQVVPPGDYHLVRFPYGRGESTDRENMHALVDPAGRQHPYPSDGMSGLILPQHDSTKDVPVVGDFWACVHWEPGDYTELRGQFSRDPYGANDSTGHRHDSPSPGVQCLTYSVPIVINSRTPVGFMVAHNASQPRRILHAKFKLRYFAA